MSLGMAQVGEGWWWWVKSEGQDDGLASPEGRGPSLPAPVKAICLNPGPGFKQMGDVFMQARGARGDLVLE